MGYSLTLVFDAEYYEKKHEERTKNHTSANEKLYNLAFQSSSATILNETRKKQQHHEECRTTKVKKMPRNENEMNEKRQNHNMYNSRNYKNAKNLNIFQIN